MVTSRSGSLPHLSHQGTIFVTKTVFNGLPLRFAHTLAAAEINGELLLFLQWYTSSDVQPNITQLAMASLPKGRGRKGGIPKRKCLRTAAATPAIIVSRSATQHTPNSSLGGNPSSASAISDAGLVGPHTFCLPSNSQLNRLLPSMLQIFLRIYKVPR